MDFSSLSRTTSDKHSTGGVGDKITLPLAPLVAVFDVAVPRLSGRGLGHTGGTLDKLEAIPGWQAGLGNEEILTQLEDIGAVICAAGSGLAPADKKLYALRDTTATVDCIPLIASSIMSKKIAEGTAGLVLDVKVGSGAFMKDLEKARRLARTMVDLGKAAGVETSAAAHRHVDAARPDSRQRPSRCASPSRSSPAGDPPTSSTSPWRSPRRCRALAGKTDVDVRAALNDGRAMDKWTAMIRAQHGDPEAPPPVAKDTEVVFAPESGVLTKLDALSVGVASWRLGAGRARKEDPVQAVAGIELHAKPGDTVAAGDPPLTLHTDTPERFERALESLVGAYEIGETPTPSPTRSSSRRSRRPRPRPAHDTADEHLHPLLEDTMTSRTDVATIIDHTPAQARGDSGRRRRPRR